MNWQPIETAPRGLVILYWPATTIGRSNLREMIRVDFAGSTPNRKPTHWMPLPPPPTTPEDAD